MKNAARKPLIVELPTVLSMIDDQLRNNATDSRDFVIRQGSFFLQWHDGLAGWGKESRLATTFDEREANRVIGKLGKRGVMQCKKERKDKT
jgi:hypothetical protein